MARLPGLLGAIAVVALLAVGCGGTVIGTEKIEETLKANFEHAREEKVSSVECPTDQKVEPKATFNCTIKLVGGGTKTETLEITDDKADVHVIGLQGEASGSNE
jgi:Domain of unknown function (DUF4333)